MKKILALAALPLALSLLGARPAGADQASHRAAVSKLLEVTRVDAMVDQMLSSIAGMVHGQFASLELTPEGMKAAEAAEQEVIAWFGELFKGETLHRMYVDIYAEVFTEEEINELIAFYESPLGQKMLDRMPDLLQKSMARTQDLVREKMPELQRKLEKQRSDLEARYPKAL